MAVSVRLDPKTERSLRTVARQKGMSQSMVVREALAQYGADSSAPSGRSRPYDAWVDVIGIVNLGARDPHRTTGDQFAATLRERSRARRPR